MAESGRRVILVAVDDSDASEKAVDWAAENLFKEGDEVHLLHIIPVPMPQVMAGSVVMDMAIPATTLEADPADDQRHINTAKEFIKRRFITKLATRSIPYKVEIVHFLCDSDSIGEAICKRADALDATAVVMSKHQRGAISEFFLGSSTK
ncbi:hypothetical protein N2152v2_005620 [Parachlorella kessleri]